MKEADFEAIYLKIDEDGDYVEPDIVINNILSMIFIIPTAND